MICIAFLHSSNGELQRIITDRVVELLIDLWRSEPLLWDQDLVLLAVCWRFGAAVTRWSLSTQLLYIEPG